MNFMISLLGWFLWNWGELVIFQKQLDDDGDPDTNFGMKAYAKKKVNMWIGSLAFVPVLLWIGSNQLSLKPLESLLGHSIEWSDLLYLAAGAAFEIFIFIIGQVQRYLKKKSQ